jgi:hypothetical protein
MLGIFLGLIVTGDEANRQEGVVFISLWGKD